MEEMPSYSDDKSLVSSAAEVNEFSSPVDPCDCVNTAEQNCRKCVCNGNIDTSDRSKVYAKFKTFGKESRDRCCRNHLNNHHNDSIAANTQVSNKRNHSIDLVITNCDDDTVTENLSSSNNEVSVTGRIAAVGTQYGISSSISAPLLQPDRQGRYRHRSGGWIPDRTTGLEDSASAARPRLRLSRDNIQPSQGSVSELHGSPKREVSQELDEEEEELDALQPLPRARSSTCPEMKAFKRKIRVRLLNRPPTPPPGECPVWRLGGREAGSDKGSVEGLAISEDVDAEEEGKAPSFNLDSPEVSTSPDDWCLRRQSEGCVLDMTIIEEAS